SFDVVYVTFIQVSVLTFDTSLPGFRSFDPEHVGHIGPTTHRESCRYPFQGHCRFTYQPRCHPHFPFIPFWRTKQILLLPPNSSISYFTSRCALVSSASPLPNLVLSHSAPSSALHWEAPRTVKSENRHLHGRPIQIARRKSGR